MALNLIVAQNAILQLSDDGEIKTTPTTPRLFTTNALDYEYQDVADCPNWLNFVDQTLGITSDSARTLQEIFGYCLVPDTSMQKLFMFIGARRGGKGVTSRVLRGLVGAHNVCNPVLGALQGQFGLEPFYGKTLAVIGDARLSGRADAGVIVERLLSISGEDAQTIDRKYKSPVTCQLKTRILLISNELPNLADASATLPSRVILLPFTRSFYGKEDPKLTEKLLGERPGILNWSLCGLRRLRERGRFVQPTESREIITQMEELASPVTAFINECCEVGPGYQALIPELFEAWKNWCEPKGRKHGDSSVFARNLLAALPHLKKTQPRTEGGRQRGYEGIRLVPAEH